MSEIKTALLTCEIGWLVIGEAPLSIQVWHPLLQQFLREPDMEVSLSAGCHRPSATAIKVRRSRRYLMDRETNGGRARHCKSSSGSLERSQEPAGTMRPTTSPDLPPPPSV
ncbi:hypothetical protein B0H13DRAFT_1918607 [Mycena leptocephala]|nr:hypothetical protein B0H13DRAFT_1918607 [Mycena leptocephala]